ncbi:pilin [Xylella fastidiosa subsp. sandyi]|uniref:Pilin n=2 Tax=Xylella fastidiosa TaxID=2371 RepID=A0AAJ5R217_XYLFS|nr:pilin [Xylella fastidiosa]WCF27753.1 pilin [Xylella fastidiosa subsp. fastidiosa]
MEKQQGFNVIELMILIVIIAVLTAITLPIYQYYIAKSQVTAALIDITHGKVQTEVRLAGGMPGTTSPNDIGLHDTTTRCHHIDVSVDSAAAESRTDSLGHHTTTLKAPPSTITCTINGNNAVNHKFIQWVRTADLNWVSADNDGNDLKGKWFCITNVAEALRPITCAVALPEMPIGT